MDLGFSVLMCRRNFIRICLHVYMQ